MRCQITQPDSVIFEVEVDPKADGQECLDKVCEKLNIVEVDYFGLQFRGSKGETLWLNLRNRIEDQLPGFPPYRFHLRVKFFVQPHYILQDATKHHFYLQVKQELAQGMLEVCDTAQMAKLVALMAQADSGNKTRNSYQRHTYEKLMEGINAQVSSDILDEIAMEHEQLHNMPRLSAEYRVLQLCGSLPNYGMGYHEAKLATGEQVWVAVGPEGVFILSSDRKQVIEKIEYLSIHMATHIDRTVLLELMEDVFEQLPKQTITFKFGGRKAAVGLYRCVTEMHSFFRCDTVRKDISTQFQRDLMGTLASLFNENTSLGKQYIFDIKRTWREAYDHARRQLYQREQQSMDDNSMETGETSMQCEDSHSCENNNCSHSCHRLEQELNSMKESFLCCVCMDNFVSTALCPCGHVICCQDCARRLEQCPICRKPIEQVQPVFIPALQLPQDTVCLGAEAEAVSVNFHSKDVCTSTSL